MTTVNDILTRLERLDLDRNELMFVVKALADSSPENVSIALDQFEATLTD